MKIVLDADIASIFAKIKEFRLLKKLFPKSRFFIVPEVVTELKKTQDLGFDWVKLVFDNTETIGLTEDELKTYEKLVDKVISLDPGEIQSIIICESREFILLTNDKNAVKYALSRRIKVLDLATLLFSLKERGICDKKELKRIIKEIEEKDFLVLKNKDRIIE